MVDKPEDTARSKIALLADARKKRGVDSGDEPPQDDGMRERVAKIEALLPTLATKADVSEVKLDLVKILLPAMALAVAILIFTINRASPAPTSQPVTAPPIVIYASPPAAAQPGK